MRRTRARLSDGREVIYYDDTGSPDRWLPDTRRLKRLRTKSEIRYDPILSEWVAIAAHRQDRTHLPPADDCPLCPSDARRSTEIPASEYEVVVFENRFPSFVTGEPRVLDDSPFLGRLAGTGRCEVVCYTSNHDGSLARAGERRIRTVIDVWADRTEELARAEGVRYVFVFENRGKEIGVTLHHPHGQIYAYPFVPTKVERKLVSARSHWDSGGSCLFCDVMGAEEKAGLRVVAADESWLAFVPAVARWPFEAHVYPRRHLPDLPATEEEERVSLARILERVLGAFENVLSRPLPYVAAWIQAPAHRDRDVAHLHLEIFSSRRAADKLKYLAGSEMGAGVFINDIPPERSAEMLRAAIP